MKNLILLSTIIFIISCSQDIKEVDYLKIVERNGIAYEINSEDPFNGLMTAYHPNGQLKSKTSFLEGMKEGNFLEYRVNGSLLYSSNYEKGSLINQTSYHPNGNMERYEVFRNNELLSIQIYDVNGNDALIDAESTPLGVFLDDNDIESDEYSYENYGNIFRFLLDLSNLEKINKPVYLNLIDEDEYTPGRILFLSPNEGSEIPSYEPFKNLYLDINLNPIKEGKVKRKYISPAMIFQGSDKKPFQKCLTRKDCEDLHKNTYYDGESYIVEHIQNYEVVEQEIFYLSGAFKVSYVLDANEEWAPNSKKPVAYYEDGSIATKYKFNMAQNIGRIEYYKNGSVGGEYDYIDDKIVLKEYFKNGELQRQTFINESGNFEEYDYKITGEKKHVVNIGDVENVKTYHANGKLAEAYSTKNYSRHGTYTGYDAGGNLIIKSNAVNGELDGECVIYNSQGELLAKWYFNNGDTNDSGYQNKYTYIECLYNGIYGVDKQKYKAFERYGW